MENELLGGILNNIVLEKAVRDKIIIQQKQQREKQARQRSQQQTDELDEFDDPQTREIMQKMRNERLRIDKEEPKKQQQRTVGQYREIKQDEFLNYVTKIKYTAVHFFHKEFQRCKIMDKHLQLLSNQYPRVQFLSIDAEKAPFFVERLSISTLPTLCVFIDGVMKDKIIGFEGLSGDEFLTYELAGRMAKSGIIDCEQPKDKILLKGTSRPNQNDSEDEY